MKNQVNIVTFLFVCLAALTMIGCDSNKLHETPENQFIGTWKLKGRPMFEGAEVRIFRDTVTKKLAGELTKLNNDKYMQLFAEVGNTWITKIERNSNFEFTITEQNIAEPLFSMYGQETTKDHKVQFINKNKFFVDSKTSEVYYLRVK